MWERGPAPGCNPLSHSTDKTTSPCPTQSFGCGHSPGPLVALTVPPDVDFLRRQQTPGTTRAAMVAAVCATPPSTLAPATPPSPPPPAQAHLPTSTTTTSSFAPWAFNVKRGAGGGACSRGRGPGVAPLASRGWPSPVMAPQWSCGGHDRRRKPGGGVLQGFRLLSLGFFFQLVICGGGARFLIEWGYLCPELPPILKKMRFCATAWAASGVGSLERSHVMQWGQPRRKPDICHRCQVTACPNFAFFWRSGPSNV